METSQCRGAKRGQRSLKPSLEGWKLVFSVVVLASRSTLETFLRGMETGDRRISIQRERYLETFLRGMETILELKLRDLDEPP